MSKPSFEKIEKDKAAALALAAAIQKFFDVTAGPFKNCIEQFEAEEDLKAEAQSIFEEELDGAKLLNATTRELAVRFAGQLKYFQNFLTNAARRPTEEILQRADLIDSLDDILEATR